MKHYKPKDAAKLLGISYPTIKQWIYEGKIQSVKTPGGHHRISQKELDRLIGTESNKTIKSKSKNFEPISVRNKLTGIVKDIKYDGLFAEVTIDIDGQQIISIITRQGCEDMRLKKGLKALALFKATEVMVSRR
jgi:molybdopterin-binding protein